MLAVFRIGVLQQGHRGRVLASATMRRLRIVAIELGMCRSGRIGGASGSVTVGNGRSRERRGEMWSRGGDGASFGDQKAVGGNTESGIATRALHNHQARVPASAPDNRARSAIATLRHQPNVRRRYPLAKLMP